MADALAQQCREQQIQRLELGLGRRTGLPRRVQAGFEARDYILTGRVFGNQIGAPAQPQTTQLQQGQRLGRGDAEKVQAIARDPTVPGPAGPPEPREPMGEALDVVALDHQLLASLPDQRHRGGAAELERLTGGDGRIRIGQQGCQAALIPAPHHPQDRCTATGAEQAAVAADLAQVVAQAPAANLANLLEQGLHRQGMLAVGQQVMHQQLLDERLQLDRQLSEEYPEIFQHLVPRQRLAGRFTAHAAAIDHIQLSGMPQQVVQVQVGLPQTLSMQPGHQRQGLAEHGLLIIRQQRLPLDRAPGVPQTLGVIEVVEQQPAALAFAQAIGQQQRRRQALPGEQAGAVQFTLEGARRLAADQQLGQYLAPTPLGHADIALPGQHAQQTLQHQGGRSGSVRQLDRQRQLRATPGPTQFSEGQGRVSLLRRRRPRRCHQCSTSAPAPR
ncbi:hypothetical protein D3C84_136840 [compost metagenome]